MDTTGGSAATLHTPVLETPAAGPRAGVRPRVTDGGGGKAGNQSDKRDAESDEVTEAGIRTEMVEERVQEGQTESRGTFVAEGGLRNKHAPGGATSSDRR